MEELEELVERFGMLSPDLISWTLENRNDIWQHSPRMKLSERAHKILRKMFAISYQSTCIGNNFIEDGSGEDVKAPIRVALDTIDLFLHVAHGEQDPPIEVKNFKELCSFALKKTDEKSIRKLCYYIFKNPIVYDRGDEFCFLLKMWNLYMMYEGNAKTSKQHFGDLTKATELSDYILRIEPEDKELDRIRRFDAPGMSGQDWENVPINERYEKADSVVAFIMDAIRHFQKVGGGMQGRDSQLLCIDELLEMILDKHYADVIPRMWLAMAERHWESGFYISRFRTLRDLLEKGPKILSIFDEIVDKSFLLDKIAIHHTEDYVSIEERQLKNDFSKVSMDLISWVVKNKSTVWQYAPDHQTIIGFSDAVKVILRRIFAEGYKYIYLKAGAYKHIGQVQIIDGRPLYVSNEFVPEGDVKDVITDALDIVHLFLAFEPEEIYPVVIKKFIELCQFALEVTDRKKLRKICYYILKNPLIFKREDQICYIFKVVNMPLMDISSFGVELELGELNGFIKRITNADEQLERMVRRSSNAIKAMYQLSKYAIVFLLNGLRSFQKSSTTSDKRCFCLDEILMEIMDKKLSDVISIFWHAMAREHWDKFYINKYRSLMVLMEREPRVLAVFNEVEDFPWEKAYDPAADCALGSTVPHVEGKEKKKQEDISVEAEAGADGKKVKEKRRRIEPRLWSHPMKMKMLMQGGRRRESMQKLESLAKRKEEKKKEQKAAAVEDPDVEAEGKKVKEKKRTDQAEAVEPQKEEENFKASKKKEKKRKLAAADEDEPQTSSKKEREEKKTFPR